MKHLVLVRFNTGNKDPSWLQHRLQFFRAFTVPSLRHQTDKNFTSVFLVDPDTPAFIVNEVEKVGLVYKTDLGQKNSVRSMEFRAFLGELLGEESCVVTSRVDSDDGLAKNYIERTNRLVTSKNEFIVYHTGVVWVDSRFFLKTYLYPPFLSMVECRVRTPAAPATVYSVKTHALVEKLSHRSYTDVPMWLMACHDRNLLNKPGELGEEISLDEVKRSFEVDVSWIR